MNKPLFIFPKYREFGDVIGDSFKFAKDNLKILSLGFLIYVVPLFILGAAITWGALQFTGTMENLGVFGPSMGSMLFILSAMLSSFMLYALVFATIDAYQDREGDIQMNDLWPYISSYIGPILLLALFYIVAMSMVVGLGALVASILGPAMAVILALIAFPLFFYFIIRFIFVLYIYVREKVGLIDSFRRSSFLVQDNWWWTFLIMFVLSIISTIMSYVVGIPVMIYSMSEILTGIEPGAIQQAPSTGVIIASGVSTMATLFTQMYFMIGIVVQYYSIREKKEGTRLMDAIDSIGSSQRSEFENEGEY